MGIGTLLPEEELRKLTRLGKMFYLSDTAEGVSDPIWTVWKTGNKPTHFIAAMSSGAKVTYRMWENLNGVALDEKQILRNRNRNFPDDGLEFQRWSSHDNGVSLPTNYISKSQTGFGANPGLQVSGSPTKTLDGMLKKNSYYLLVITPSVETDITFDILWWED